MDKSIEKLKKVKIYFKNSYYGRCIFYVDKSKKAFELRYTDYHDNKIKIKTYKKLKDLIIEASMLGIPKRGYQKLLWIYFNV